MNIQRLNFGVVLIAAGLAGCSIPPSHLPSIDDALAPYEATPRKAHLAWNPRAGQAESAPDLRASPRVPVGNALVDPAKTYHLADLVDLGLRANPSTRGAWEEARAAAASLGIAEAAWLPTLGIKAPGGYGVNPHPSTGGPFSVEGVAVYPTLDLSWTLFDMARPAKIEQALQQLYSANLSLNRTHQQVAYAVETAFFTLLAARAKVKAAEATLRQAAANAESVQAQLDHGLATRPELLLAVQDQAKAGYELQTAKGGVMDGEAQFAESLGITPNQSIRTVELADVPVPKEIETSADQIIDQALLQRPDLAAKLAELRGQDAAIRKAEAGYWPTLAFTGDIGYKRWNYTQHGGEGSGLNVNFGSPLLDAYLTFSWNLFEGFATQNAVSQAASKRNAAQAEFDALQLQIIKTVWKSYADVKTAFRKREFALAMLKAGEQSYEATLASYRQGLSTVIDLLTAERNLASARYTEIDSKASLLQAAAALVYAAGSAGDKPTVGGNLP